MLSSKTPCRLQVDYDRDSALHVRRWWTVMLHVQEGLHWSELFTARLSKEVKLVGSTISCETAQTGPKGSYITRHHAHVQSYVMATDQVLCTAPDVLPLIGYP